MPILSRMSPAITLSVGVFGLLTATLLVHHWISAPDRAQTTSHSDSDKGIGEATSDRPEETVQALASHLETQRTHNQQLAETVEDLARQLKQIGAAYQSMQAESQTWNADQAVRADEGLNALRMTLLDEMANQIGALEARVTESGYPVNGRPERVEGKQWIVHAPSPLSNTEATIGRDGFYSTVGGVNLKQFDGSDDPPTPVPVWTIPADATLTGSRALTALIGRVPVKGEVADPMPFKILTGSENLLANGHRMPEIHQAIWSGVAFGDRTLHCVTGRLTQVTFVFSDGTIHTWPSTTEPFHDRPLGWITNSQGWPCIPGRYVSNLDENITQLTAASTAAGLADAWSVRATTQTRIGESLTTAVTGDPIQYGLGQGVSAGINAWARIVADRAQDTFDAVVVEPGLTLTVHVQSEIPIDWSSDRRQVRHLSSVKATAVRVGGVD